MMHSRKGYANMNLASVVPFATDNLLRGVCTRSAPLLLHSQSFSGEHFLLCMYPRTPQGWDMVDINMSFAPLSHSPRRRSRSALLMTDTELNVMAALAIMGLRSSPHTGYSTPAAIGIPMTL